MKIIEHIPLNIQPRFSFVAVFRERVEYTRSYNLPFNMIAICSRENVADPSVVENTETGERFVFHKNDVSLTCCGTPLKFRYTTANEHLCIHFLLELFPGVDVFAGLKRRYIICDEALQREGKMIFSDLSDPIRSLARCQAFALRVCELHWPEDYPYELNKVLPFEPILNYVRDNVNASITVSQLATRMNRSDGYFSRSFQEAFRISPKQFLLNELYSHAAHLLLDPEKNVKIVANELKFSSEFYFSRFFKRMSGESPSNYRDSARNILNVRK